MNHSSATSARNAGDGTSASRSPQLHSGPEQRRLPMLVTVLGGPCGEPDQLPQPQQVELLRPGPLAVSPPNGPAP